MEQPLSVPLFVGRDKEFEWLERRTYGGAHRPIVIHGPHGIGKSAFLHYFAASLRGFQSPRVWTLPSDPREANVMLAVAIDELRNEKQPPRVVAIDNADAMSPAEIMDVTQRLLNRKAIQSVIFARREPIEEELTRGQLRLEPFTDEEGSDFIRHGHHVDFPAAEMPLIFAAAKGNPGALALLHELTKGKSYTEIKQLISGQLYDQDQALVVPDKRLILAAKPRIITTNELLIEKLQKEPEGLYALHPRKFEEIIADLMEDMGYDVELTPRSNDGGKDILASQMTEHGKMLCLVEAKRYSITNPVQVALVRQLYGTLCNANATSAMLVTTSRFTRGAREFQQNNEYRLSLRDYGGVVQWLDGYRAGSRSN